MERHHISHINMVGCITERLMLLILPHQLLFIAHRYDDITMESSMAVGSLRFSYDTVNYL